MFVNHLRSRSLLGPICALSMFAATANASGDRSVALSRFTADTLAMESSFGNLVNIGRGSAVDAATDSRRRIIVAEHHGDTGVVSRYTTSGSVDTSFGVDGAVDVGHPNPRIALDARGRIVVSGIERNSIVLRRLTSAGRVDTTFNAPRANFNRFSAPFVQTRRVELDVSAKIGIDSLGRIVVAAHGVVSRRSGSRWSTPRGAVFVARYLPDGSIDTTFGEVGSMISRWPPPRAGTRVTEFSDAVHAFPWVTDLVVDSSDRIVLIGDLSTRSDGNRYGVPNEGMVVRYDTDGRLDTSFGDGGLVALPASDFPLSGGYRVHPRSVVFDPDDGSVFVGLSVHNNSAEGFNHVLSWVVALGEGGDWNTDFAEDGLWEQQRGMELFRVALDTAGERRLFTSGRIAGAGTSALGTRADDDVRSGEAPAHGDRIEYFPILTLQSFTSFRPVWTGFTWTWRSVASPAQPVLVRTLR